MTCNYGRETVVRTGEAPSLGRKADRIALTGEVTGFPRLNRRPYGRGHGDSRARRLRWKWPRSLTPPVPVSMISCGHPLQKLSSLRSDQ